jgi:hypothetical protein
VLSISPPGLRSSSAAPGAIETCAPPSRLSLVILAVESDGSLTVGSMVQLGHGQEGLGLQRDLRDRADLDAGDADGRAGRQRTGLAELGG